MKVLSSLRAIYITLSVLLITLASVKQQAYFLLLLKVVSLCLLLFYYLKYVEKPKLLHLGIIIGVFLSELLFFFDKKSVYGLSITFLYRFLLFFLIVQNSKNLKDNFLKIFTVTFLSGLLIIASTFKSSLAFYLVILNALLIIFAITIAFINLIHSAKRGNFEFFIIFMIFAFFESVFSLIFLEGFYRLVILSLVYQIAYYLIIQGVLKQQLKLK